MLTVIYNFITQSLPFLPLALAIYISFNLMNATDLTLDGSFVAGAGVFAKLISMGISPILSTFAAMCAGVCTGALVACMQRHQRIDALLAGILATFILASGNLIMMGRPNINLLSQNTLVSSAFATSDTCGYLLVGIIVAILCGTALLLLKSSFGLRLRAFGDNPQLFTRYGFATERYRCFGFSLTNCLAACAGCLTAQTVGYADINMGVGMTLTGLGAIIAGQQLTMRFLKRNHLRIGFEFLACLMGVLLYFALMNTLLRLGVDPLYLKIVLGLILIFFLRNAHVKAK
ncbi:MAG: ABC transporter permease [Pseudomonadota bacterium]